MQSNWLNEASIHEGSSPGYVTRLSRRARAFLAALSSIALVAVGLTFVAAPAQANGSIPNADFASEINNSFVVELADIDTTAVALLTSEGRGAFSAVDATVGGAGLDLINNSYIEVVDATNVLLYLDTGDTTGTLTAFSVTITDGTYTYTEAGTGTLSLDVGATDVGGIDTVFQATAPPDGSKQATFNLRYPTDGTTTWTIDLFAAFNASTGIEVPITSATFTDATIIGGSYWLVSGSLTVDAAFGTSIRFGNVDVDGQSVYGALSNAVLLTAGNGGGGGGSSTPTAPVTPTVPVTPPAVTDPDAAIIANPSATTPAQIAALTPAQVAALPPTTFGRLPGPALAAISPEQFIAVTPQQLEALPPAAIAVLNPAVFKVMTTTQLRVLIPSQMREVNGKQTAQMPRPLVRTFTWNAEPLVVQGEVFRSTVYKGSQLEALRPRAVRGFTPAAINGMIARQIAAMRPATYAAMRPAQTAALRPAQVKFIRASQIKRLTPKAVASIRPKTIAALSPKQLAAVTPKQAAALTNAQKRALGM